MYIGSTVPIIEYIILSFRKSRKRHRPEFITRDLRKIPKYVQNFKKILFLFQLGNKVAYEAYLEGGEDALKEYIYSKMWNPEYRPLVYLPPGKGE